MANFEIERFRTYGTLDLVVEIPVRYINVTAKDKTLSAKQLIRSDILCRLPLGNGHKGDNENRPRESLNQGKTLFSDEIECGFKKIVTYEKRVFPNDK